MKVLGCDPGTHKMGWGYIEGDRRACSLFRFGVIKPLSKRSLPDRLAHIYDELGALCVRFKPQVIVCEDPFLAKDMRAAMNIGRAWAMAALAASKNSIVFSTYSPLEIKKSTTGYGRASKEQVSGQIKRLLGTKEDIPEDATDALACAFCYITDMRNYKFSG